MCNGKMSHNLSAPGFPGAFIVKAGGLGYGSPPHGELMLLTRLHRFVLANRCFPGCDVKCIIAELPVDGICGVMTPHTSSNWNPSL